MGKNCRFFSNIEQMCDALRISTKTGYKLLHEGKIPAMKIGRSYRIPKAHLFTYLQICGQHCRAEKCEIVCADRAKTKSSLRSLPLVSNIREKLLALREQQKENRRVCGNCYSKKYDGYVFVDAMGNIFNPRSVTANFSKLLEQNGLRHIRFHDLRHSCASLLLANDVPLKQIQEWLGHSDIGTTANIYSHLDYKSKITSANVMDNILTLPDTRQTGWHT